MYGGDKCETNLAQTKSDDETGALATGKYEFGKGDGFPKALETAQKYLKQFSRAEDIPDEDVPMQFDWRNIEGYDFTGRVRD